MTNPAIPPAPDTTITRIRCLEQLVERQRRELATMRVAAESLRLERDDLVRERDCAEDALSRARDRAKRAELELERRGEALREAELGFLAAHQMFDAICCTDPSVDRRKARDAAWGHRLRVLAALAAGEGKEERHG